MLMMNDAQLLTVLNLIGSRLSNIEKMLEPKEPKYACHVDDCIQHECSIDLDQRYNCRFAQVFHVKEHCPHWREI